MRLVFFIPGVRRNFADQRERFAPLLRRDAPRVRQADVHIAVFAGEQAVDVVVRRPDDDAPGRDVDDFAADDLHHALLCQTNTRGAPSRDTLRMARPLMRRLSS